MLFALDLIKDVLGLIGSLLVAWPFFTQEGVKSLATRLRNVKTDDQAVRTLFQGVAARQEAGLNQPNEWDMNLTRIGLIFIILSFLISMAVTLTMGAPPR
jgi:hypothetical protein